MSFLTNTLLQISTAKPSFTGDDLYRVLPELIVLVMAVLVVNLDLFLPTRLRPSLG